MDWSSLLIGLVLGILGNLLTPSVRAAIVTTFTWVGSRLSGFNERGLKLRLSQLEERHERIKRLRDNPNELTYMVTARIMAVLMITWLIILFGCISLLFPEGTFKANQPWAAVLGSILGLGTRHFVSVLVAWDTAEKVTNFAEFEKKNSETIEKILSFLSKK